MYIEKYKNQIYLSFNDIRFVKLFSNCVLCFSSYFQKYVNEQNDRGC